MQDVLPASIRLVAVVCMVFYQHVLVSVAAVCEDFYQHVLVSVSAVCKVFFPHGINISSCWV